MQIRYCIKGQIFWEIVICYLDTDEVGSVCIRFGLGLSLGLGKKRILRSSL